MKKSPFLIIFLLLFIFGCATTSRQTGAVKVPQVTNPEKEKVKVVEAEKYPKEEVPQKEETQQLKNIDDKKIAEYAEKKGVIFGKTDFEGVLEKRFVRLFFEDINNPQNTFQLHIGDKSKQVSFPWDVEPLKPGYFFTELPAGKYRITSITIPVGTSMAVEPIDIVVEVSPGAVTYIGTLKIVGTKEKIRLGGVPLIKPGFEYTAEIIDERDEGIKQFLGKFPNFTSEILVNLMKVNTLKNSQ